MVDLNARGPGPSGSEKAEPTSTPLGAGGESDQSATSGAAPNTGVPSSPLREDDTPMAGADPLAQLRADQVAAVASVRSLQDRKSVLEYLAPGALATPLPGVDGARECGPSGHTLPQAALFRWRCQL